MAKKKSIAEKAGEFELNLTPMIDAVFLLLIFFTKLIKTLQNTLILLRTIKNLQIKVLNLLLVT